MDIIPQLVINSVIAGSIYALVALGFNLIFSTTRFFNLTHGVVAAVGGYGVFTFFKLWDLNLYVAIALGIVVAALVGWLSDFLVFKKMRRDKASGMVLLVASLGLFTALQAVIAIMYSSQFQTLSTNVASTRVFRIAGGVMTDVQLVILAAAIAIMLLLAFVMHKTRFGKAVQAVADDEEVAKIVGIQTDKIIGKVFLIGSAIAGVAGIAMGFDTGIEPTMGMGLLLKGVVASIIGGIGNVYGGVLGAFLLAFVENFGIWKISGEWKDAIAFTLLIIFLLVRPQGIIKRA
jgi:branched-subunit amino acid ABC-type transport system permease component